MKLTTVYGGVGQNPQVTALRAGVDVLVACPGRLEDLIGQGHVHLDAIEVTVLDEADHMADLGFLPGVKRLLDRTPTGTQRLLFSATLDNGVDVLVKRYLRNPVTHSVEAAKADTAAMEHHVLAVSAADKPAVVREPRRRPGPQPAVHAHQAHRQEARQAGDGGRHPGGRACTATCRRVPASGTSRRSARATCGCWWPPTSRPAASTSTTSAWSCTSTRRPSTRRTPTAPAGRRAPVPPVSSSPS
ncbi:hypothetical protein GCM10025868_01280 [Angustibacter aerolatus]|uniref:Helicase ATP-binding domain-containing protein n=1 Tax=Angustibacter aerolatus TaxID=1162965 RepID=A0ABQ6J9Q1_9ACTN|nr:hypothetical protein GCM10025868_01280 [Angustibacter aerolatus]